MSTKAFARCHAAVNFGFFVAAIGFSVMIQHPAYLAVGMAGAMCLHLSLNGPRAARTFLVLLPLWIFLTLLNPLLNTHGEHVLFRIFGRPYTWEALCYGVVVGGMFVIMLLWMSSYNVIMTEDKFTYLFANLAPSLALILTMIFRLVPSFLRKIRQIMDARKCIGKGAGENAGTKEKMEHGMTVISVMTAWALEGSVVTSDSMNSRGYGTARRTCFQQFSFRKEDLAVSLILVLGIIGTICGLVQGSGSAVYTPILAVEPVTAERLPGLLAYGIFIFTPTILNLKEELIWHISRSKI